MSPTIGSLCTGYGGLDMAVQTIWPDSRLAWVADNDPGAARILAHHHPDVPNLGDLTQINWQATEPVDILTAGFPCQPVSVAGRRAGTTDERWLFDDITRALRDLHPQPRLCVFENVPGLLTADHGDAMARVVQGLASVGYVGGYGVLAASTVGAPHRRERVFIVAWPADAESDTRRLVDRVRAHAADADRPGRGRVGRVVPGGRDADRRGRADRHGAPGEPAPHVMLPTPRATDGTKGEPNQHGPSGDLMLTSAVHADRFGDYAPAIHRWEQATRPAPHPTTPNERTDKPRLNPAFAEWLMGLPNGHITHPDIWHDMTKTAARNAALHAAGNGVVPQQATTATQSLLNRHFPQDTP